MDGSCAVMGINLTSLEEAFSGNEDVLTQMLSLFQVQAAERVQQFEVYLTAWDEMSMRTVLHSLVNIAGAVRAFGLSDLAKALGDAVKHGDRDKAQALTRSLVRESAYVLSQVKVLLAAAQMSPGKLWTADLSALPPPV
jgi:hypothetical protein